MSDANRIAFYELIQQAKEFGSKDKPVPGVGVSAAANKQQSAQNRFNEYLRMSFLYMATVNLTAIAFTSVEDVDDMLREWLTALEELLPNMDDELYQASTEMQQGVIAELERIKRALTPQQIYTPEASLPLSVIAYQHYGNANAENLLLAFNRESITHPLFVDQPLKLTGVL